MKLSENLHQIFSTYVTNWETRERRCRQHPKFFRAGSSGPRLPQLHPLLKLVSMAALLLAALLLAALLPLLLLVLQPNQTPHLLPSSPDHLKLSRPSWSVSLPRLEEEISVVTSAISRLEMVVI